MIIKRPFAPPSLECALPSPPAPPAGRHASPRECSRASRGAAAYLGLLDTNDQPGGATTSPLCTYREAWSGTKCEATPKNLFPPRRQEDSHSCAVSSAISACYKVRVAVRRSGI